MQVRINKNKIRSFTSYYRKESYKALAKTFVPVLDAARVSPPVDLKMSVVNLLKTEHVEAMLFDLYVKVGTAFALDIIQKIRAKKEDGESFYSAWYRRYAADRSKKIAQQILDTMEENINLTIDRVVATMTREGAGIIDIAKNLESELSRELVEIEAWESIRIAQTEVIGTANMGSFQGATDSGIVGMQKGWMTSGNINTRPAHLMHEAHGFVDMDFDYGIDSGSVGLRFPGDPECADPSEIINCHCTIIYQFD